MTYISKQARVKSPEVRTTALSIRPAVAMPSLHPVKLQESWRHFCIDGVSRPESSAAPLHSFKLRDMRTLRGKHGTRMKIYREARPTTQKITLNSALPTKYHLRNLPKHPLARRWWWTLWLKPSWIRLRVACVRNPSPPKCRT